MAANHFFFPFHSSFEFTEHIIISQPFESYSFFVTITMKVWNGNDRLWMKFTLHSWEKRFPACNELPKIKLQTNNHEKFVLNHSKRKKHFFFRAFNLYTIADMCKTIKTKHPNSFRFDSFVLSSFLTCWTCFYRSWNV